MVSVIPTPLAFLEVDEELFFSDTFEFHHTILGKAPERLDSIDMVFASHKFIFMVVNMVMGEDVIGNSIPHLAGVFSDGLDPAASCEVGSVLMPAQECR